MPPSVSQNQASFMRACKGATFRGHSNHPCPPMNVVNEFVAADKGKWTKRKKGK